MRGTTTERELNENTLAVIWKYLKTIAWVHLQELLSKAPSR